MKLLILEIHGRLIHAGVSHTLNQLRQEYWIPHGRVEVKHLLHQSVNIIMVHLLVSLICHHGQKKRFQYWIHSSMLAWITSVLYMSRKATQSRRCGFVYSLD